MQQKIGILSILYGLYRVPIFCYTFYFFKGGDENGGTTKQVNENKEYPHGHIALFLVLRWGQAQKGTSYHIIMWPPGVAFAILFPYKKRSLKASLLLHY